jgi:hypothetical protein
MKRRHVTHEAFTLAAIEDILARRRMPDWVPLIAAIRADPFGEVPRRRACCANAACTAHRCSAVCLPLREAPCITNPPNLCVLRRFSTWLPSSARPARSGCSVFSQS